ncbi:MAG: hypothetical protein K6B74_01345 [Ruminococcus sp.]|nr:hypothetical protein [Ruminococcus sp.]
MENRTVTNPFYELLDRLYAAAAAGTAVIPEDFRLRRAVDGFEPLAQKNKVFAKLHKMCTDMLTSENTPACTNKFVPIADCLALAEALAVTQGSFSDSSETTPINNAGFTPRDIPNSKLTELTDVIIKAKNSIKEFPPELAEFADDPRLVRAFLDNCDNNSENFGKLAKIFCKKCGGALVQPLFDSIDMTNPKATGRQIEFITQITGGKYADRFRQLAFDENAPAGVRINCINALGHSAENSGDLIELYQTSKNKVATAALEAIARISPPQAEPIFAKLAEKFKPAYITAFSLAKYPVCSQLARSELAKSIDKPWVDFPVKIANMLCGKTDVYDCFDKLAQRAPKYGGYGQLLERILLSNITHSGDPAYTAMIEQLYRKYPDTMFFTKLVSDIMVKGEAAFELPKDIIDRYIGKFGSLIDNLIAYPDGYHLTMWKMDDAPKLKDTVLFERLPDKLLKILAETPYKTKDREDRRNYSLLSLIRKCAPADTERVTNAALTFALDSFKKVPELEPMYLLEEYGRLPDGAITDHIMYYVTKLGKIFYYEFTAMYSRFRDPGRVPAELEKAAEQIKKMQNKLASNTVSDSLREINRALEIISRTKK